MDWDCSKEGNESENRLEIDIIWKENEGSTDILPWETRRDMIVPFKYLKDQVIFSVIPGCRIMSGRQILTEWEQFPRKLAGSLSSDVFSRGLNHHPS